MSDPDTLSTSDRKTTKDRTAQLYQAYQQWRALPVPFPFGHLGVGLFPVNLFSLLSTKPAVAEQSGLTASSPTVDEAKFQHEAEMLADIDRIIARLDEEVPQAIDAMDHLLTEIHEPKKRLVT